MDKLAKYRHFLKEIVLQQARYKSSYDDIESLAVCDTERDQYLLMGAGWDRNGRTHSVYFHARIKNGKVWIEWDGTDPSMTEELLRLGIPKEDMVLAFYSPEHRKITDFAVA